MAPSVRVNVDGVCALVVRMMAAIIDAAVM